MPKIFNKGKRTITFTHIHGGKQVKDSIAPNTHKTVDENAAALLKAQWGHEIIDLDSKEDLQAQFKAEAPVVRAAGYLSPEEVEREKQSAVEAALKEEREKNAAAAAAVIETAKPNQVNIEGMDRAQLIAYIEQEKLDIDYGKLKNPDALKNAVLNATKASAE